MIKQLTFCTLFGTLVLSSAAIAQICTNTNMVESTPTDRYTFNTDGTVTDDTTHLMWKRCLEGQIFSDNGTPNNFLDDTCSGGGTILNWQGAFIVAEATNTLNIGVSHTDWRVPNLKELKSIVEHCRVIPAVNTEVFPNAESLVLWSSSPIYEYGAWVVDFDGGNGSWDDRNGGVAVRLVHSAQ